MKKIFVVFILLLAWRATFADTLTGLTLDTDSKKPIEGVSIYIQELNLITISDIDGKFFFSNLEPGTYKITIKRIGYTGEKLEINFPETNKLNIHLKFKPLVVEGIKISSTKARERETPVTFTNLLQEEIIRNNYGQEIPMLLDEVPGVFTYSDAGGIIGNAHLNIRGFDQKRIGVMINGIPLNDPEDHNVYWVNMPDFAESTSDIQFQRGVGSSLYGISTFGGSLNMQTSPLILENRTEVFASYGSYKTYKTGVKLAGRFGKYSTNIRFSKVGSDGYRDNSVSDLWAIFTNISRIGDKSVTEFNFYTGHELTHAAWEASWEGDLEVNHQHNPYTYDNYVDDFSQPHFELHHSYFLNERSDIKNSFFYIRGKGFYEQYKYDRNLWEHGLVAEDNDEEADMIRQKWVTKNHYGWVSQYNLRHKMGSLTLGSYLSLFDSDHWGEIIEVIGADTLEISYEEGQNYYNYTGDKQYITFYGNELFKPINNLSLMVNLYFQHINYEFAQLEAGNFAGEYLNSYEVDYNFFNPRFGINYNLNENFNIYGNVSLSNREPTDDELYDTWDGPDDLGVAPLFATADTVFTDTGAVERINWSEPYVKEEKLVDYEFGIGYVGGIWNLQTNLFWMNFADEIVPYGSADDEGSPIRGNADKTVHRGVELSAKMQLPANLEFSGNFSYSDNYFQKFKMYTWDENWNVVQVDFKDKTIAGFPKIITSGKLSYKTEPLQLFTQLQYVGKQFLDNTENEERTIDPFMVVNVGVSFNLAKLFGKTDLQLNVRINNILDEEYETAGYYDPWGGPDWSGANYYWPAADRNFMAGIRVGF
ncbi:MAG: TonB-dependent receptor [Candidatus Cloacimonetes bacterium]|nr:TonB-dependent receptor [Candidatus Cloacimonadota bacterium]